MSLKGNLETFNLTSLLQLLSDDQKTGVLQVNNNENSVRIFMKDGLIVSATSTQTNMQLGNLMLSRKIISREDLMGCLKEAKQQKRKLGGVLIKNGFCSKEDLRGLLHYQVKEILYTLFLWNSGQFEYKDVNLNVEGKLLTVINTMEILLEASRRIDEWSLITELIPSDNIVFKISDKSRDRDEVKLNNEEWNVLSLVDGNSTVRHLIENSRQDEFEVFKNLYSLFSSGLIEKAEKGEDIEEIFPEIIDLYLEIVKAIQKPLQKELGDRTHSFFEQCKEDLLSDQNSFFKDMSLQSEHEENRRSLFEALQSHEKIEDGSEILQDGFISLFESLLGKENSMLGKQITKDTIREIKQIVSAADHYHRETPEKKKHTQALQVFLERFDADLDDGKDSAKSSGGKFSFFKKK